MAQNELSTITIDNVQYNLCDISARTHLMSKHGDTVDGNILVAGKYTSSQNSFGYYIRPNNSVALKDQQGECTSGFLRLIRKDTGDTSHHFDVTLAAEGVVPKTNSADLAYSTIQSLKLSGAYNSKTSKWEPTVTISSAAQKPWRDAIKAMGTVGHNTITDGSLTVNTGYLKVMRPQGKDSQGKAINYNTSTTAAGRIFMPAGGYIVTKDMARGKDYCLLGDNNTDIWIGASKETDATHHTGAVYISSGWDAASPTKPNETIYISVPDKNSKGTTTNKKDNAISYKVYHENNISNAFTIFYKTYKFTVDKAIGHSYYVFTENFNDTTQYYTTLPDNLRPLTAWGTLLIKPIDKINKKDAYIREYSDSIKSKSNYISLMQNVFKNQGYFGKGLGYNISQVIFSPPVKTTINNTPYTKITGGFWAENLVGGATATGTSSGTSAPVTLYANIAFLCVKW